MEACHVHRHHLRWLSADTCHIYRRLLPDDVGRSGLWKDSEGNSAYLHHKSKMKSASARTTEAWFHDMREATTADIEDHCILLLDNAKWHKSAAFADECDEANVQVIFYLPTAGVWLDPLDQEFHHALRRGFKKLQADNSASKIENIVRAYYEISEDQIKGSWAHTSMLLDNYEEHLTLMANEGFNAGPGRREMYERSEQAWQD